MPTVSLIATPRSFMNTSQRTCLLSWRGRKCLTRLTISKRLPPRLPGNQTELDVGSEQVRLAVSLNHPFARHRSASLADAAREPFVGLTREDFPDYHRYLATLFAQVNNRKQNALRRNRQRLSRVRSARLLALPASFGRKAVAPGCPQLFFRTENRSRRAVSIVSSDPCLSL